MSIDDWARKVAADVLAVPGERAPMDVVLFAHLREFEEIARRTSLKIPAFARALTRAGLTVRNGRVYSAETLRAQINRARSRRNADPVTAIEPLTAAPKLVVVRRDELSNEAAYALADSDAATKVDRVNVLKKLERLKPRRPTTLGSEY